MAEISPRWALTIYAKLWASFRDKSFSREQANEAVKNKSLSQALSRLKRDGWLEISLHPKNARKSLYTLKDPKDIVEEIGKGSPSRKSG